MISNVEQAHSELEAKIAQKYRAQGFDVILHPPQTDLPFDLGTYRPDLLVKKSSNEGYIIEVKGSVSRTPIDRYREISEIVAQHPGWSFLLVTGEDVSSSEQQEGKDELMTWEQMFATQEKAKKLISLGEVEGAFFLLWGVLEAALRQHAKEVSIPIERFPSPSLINHLYSQGELSIEQYDRAKALQQIRNRLVHGYQTSHIEEPTKQLQGLAKELLQLWGKQ